MKIAARLRRVRAALTLGLCGLALSAGAGAETLREPQQAPLPTQGAEREAAPTSYPIRIGGDFYSGISDLNGNRRFGDGMWAGSSVFLPSVAHMAWSNGKGHAAKASFGTGSLFNGASRAFDQPAEAWYRAPVGKVSMTVGKYWIPFAQQEWQLETKPGVLLQWQEGATSIDLSANYNYNLRTSNTYLRVGRSRGEDVAVGVSIGAGKGLSFDSDHDLAYGVDVDARWRGFRLAGEYLTMRAPASKGHYFQWTELR